MIPPSADLELIKDNKILEAKRSAYSITSCRMTPGRTPSVIGAVCTSTEYALS